MNSLYNPTEKDLFAKVDLSKIPQHVGIIMDGNGRWAQLKGKSRVFGHQEGAKRVQSIVRLADDMGVKHISLYAFSTENWTRPRFEVRALMRLIRAYIIRERKELHAQGAKFNLIGRLHELPPELIKEVDISTNLMKNNQGISLNLCINYSGKSEIVDALKSIVKKQIPPDKITEELISQHLYCPNVPDLDLVIRTSGEMRTSNFHLWRASYAEYYFTDILWPDFDNSQFLTALISYQNRERRFGKTSAQMAGVGAVGVQEI